GGGERRADARSAALAARGPHLHRPPHPGHPADGPREDRPHRQEPEQRDRCSMRPLEAARSLATIREQVGILWQTSEVRARRPTDASEVCFGLDVAELELRAVASGAREASAWIEGRGPRTEGGRAAPFRPAAGGESG